MILIKSKIRALFCFNNIIWSPDDFIDLGCFNYFNCFSLVTKIFINLLINFYKYFLKMGSVMFFYITCNIILRIELDKM
jgi:hypothetical protein